MDTGTDPGRVGDDDLVTIDIVKDIVKVLREYRRTIFRWTFSVTALAALAGGYYYWAQSTRWTASIGFRPIFTGAEKNRYPNDLPFGPSDITSASVMDGVYDRNDVQSSCGRDDFRGGFFVELSSTELNFLDLEYQARLANPQLTGPERERLQNEYTTRRTGLPPVQYRLSFVRPGPCASLPDTIVFKALHDVLSTWSEEAETKRGVLKLRVPILTPNIFDLGDGSARGLFTKTVLLHSALDRAIANIRKVEALPGAELVRYGEKKISFSEIKLKLEDLGDARFESLVALAGDAFGRNASRWAEESLATARGKSQEAESRVQAYLSALREYSGLSSPATTATASAESAKSANASDVQSLTPQVDRTFIDRIVELSAANLTFRQELTRSLVEESVKAIESRAEVDYYENLLKSLRRSTIRSPDEVEQALNEIIAEAKESMGQFVALYEEFSRVALKPATAMYRIEQSPQVVVLRTFSLRQYQLLVLASFFISLLVTFLGCIVHDRLRQPPASRAQPSQ